MGVLGADGGGCDLPFEESEKGRRGRNIGKFYVLEIDHPLFGPSTRSLSLFFPLALTLDIIYTLSPSFSSPFLHLHYNSVDFPLGTDRQQPRPPPSMVFVAIS